MVCIGDKSRNTLQRTHASNFLLTGNDIGRTPPTFDDASIAAKAILESGFEFDEVCRRLPSSESTIILSKKCRCFQGMILYNRFKTVVSYQTSRMPIMTFDVCGSFYFCCFYTGKLRNRVAHCQCPKVEWFQNLKKKEALLTYDSVDDDVLQSYNEYSLAQLIYYAMKESATSEQASRMTAMDGASKNAGLLSVQAVYKFSCLSRGQGSTSAEFKY